MKKTVRGKTYNTDTAELICASKFFYLYRRIDGSYFTCHPSGISPIDKDVAEEYIAMYAAPQMAQDFLNGNDPDTRSRADANISLYGNVLDFALKAAAEAKISLDEYINRLILKGMRNELNTDFY